MAELTPAASHLELLRARDAADLLRTVREGRLLRHHRRRRQLRLRSRERTVDPPTTSKEPHGRLTETDIREQVRERYAGHAQLADRRLLRRRPRSPRRPAAARPVSRASGATCSTTPRRARAPPTAAVAASLGCGVPTAVADLHEGETVLDLGSGAGADVLISARRVGPTGRAIGLDMTDEMLELARAQRRRGRRDQRRVPQGLHRGDPAARRERRRRDLQLRDQPLRRQAPRDPRGRARAAPRRALRRLRRDRRSRHGRRHARGHAAVDRLHRRRAHARRVRERARTTPASIDVEITETHRVHEHAGVGHHPRPQALVRAQRGRDDVSGDEPRLVSQTATKRA